MRHLKSLKETERTLTCILQQTSWYSSAEYWQILQTLKPGENKHPSSPERGVGMCLLQRLPSHQGGSAPRVVILDFTCPCEHCCASPHLCLARFSNMHSLSAPHDLHDTRVQKLGHKLCLPTGSRLFSSPSRKNATFMMKGCTQLVSLSTKDPAMGQGSIYTKHRRHVRAGNTRGFCCLVWTLWCLDK
ncbi:uncharacterized protein [Aphelocoma coerulescens]|uniref:uncharacterized protein isoform X2 n=1 Tax=Aphelocoma coerulescens TaxID=39617 RepID=UPI003604ADC7